MDKTIPDKAFFRIGEVSRILEVEPYVIRYWESVFKTVRPERTRSDQRRYRRQDVRELLIIKDLLYRERFTIAGAKKQLRRIRRGEAPEPESRVPDADGRMAELKEGLTQIRQLLE